MSVYYFFPFRLDKDLGRAYNDHVRLVPSMEDWIVVKDYDVAFLDPSFARNIETAIAVKPDAGLLTCYTNRVGAEEQLYPGMYDVRDMASHRKVAAYVGSQPLTFKKFNKILSGMVMAFKKETWSLAGGFPQGGKCLGVDNEFCRRVMRLNREILLVENVYAFHYYRMCEGRKYKEHLK